MALAVDRWEMTPPAFDPDIAERGFQSVERASMGVYCLTPSALWTRSWTPRS